MKSDNAKDKVKKRTKSILWYVRYLIQEAFHWCVGGFGVLWFGMYIMRDIPIWISIVIMLIWFAFLFFTDEVLRHNGSKFLCKYETKAELIDTVSDIFTSFLAEGKFMSIHSRLTIVEYEYNGKKYKSSMVFSDREMKKTSGRVHIRVCKFCPKLIYIEEDINDI